MAKDSVDADDDCGDEDEVPSYGQMVEFVGQMPDTWLPGLLFEVVAVATRQEVFASDGMILKAAARAIAQARSQTAGSEAAAPTPAVALVALEEQLGQIFTRAADHALAASNSDYEVGDLQVALRAAFLLLTDEQRIAVVSSIRESCDWESDEEAGDDAL